jgi:hypothetical protein
VGTANTQYHRRPAHEAPGRSGEEGVHAGPVQIERKAP